MLYMQYTLDYALAQRIANNYNMHSFNTCYDNIICLLSRESLAQLPLPSLAHKEELDSAKYRWAYVQTMCMYAPPIVC